MATYFHHHNHHGDNPDIITPQAQADGLQTLILMNPNFVGYSVSVSVSGTDTHPPPLLPSSSFNAPPPLPPHLVGVPLYPPSAPTAWTQPGPMTAGRESPRTQQGLSLTLSSHNHLSYDDATVSAHAEPGLRPTEQTTPGAGSSESPTVAVGASLGVGGAGAKYLKAAQDLLEEVVNVNINRVKADSATKSKSKGESPPAAAFAGGGAEEEPAAELSIPDRQELQMKKAKLVSLLDEVEQRHRLYHQQMQMVVSSFEQIAGPGSAKTYTSIALKTISNQFRSLRDTIFGQIRAANKSLGEGGGEGESGSKLRLFHHQIRQQRTVQQLGMIQNNAWRPQRGLPEKAVSVLRAWLFEHFLHPYPKDSDKIMLAKQTGLTRSQVSNWFINARVRLWKPMVEEMYAEELKEHQETGSDGKSSKQDQHGEHGSTSVFEEKDNVGNREAKTENHNSSTVITSSTASIGAPFRSNSEKPSRFTFVGSSKTESETQGSLKKQRNNENLTFPDAAELFSGNRDEVPSRYDPGKQDESSIISSSATSLIGGLGSYTIGEMERFGAGQFPPSFSGNGVSLTLGLPHCDSLSLPGTNQAFLPNNQDLDQYRGRLDIGEFDGFGGVKAPNASRSRSAYGAQLLPDFVT